MLLDLAKQMPVSTAELKHIRGLSEGSIRNHGNSLVQCIEESKKLTPKVLEYSKRKTKLTPNQDAMLDLLTTVVKIHARDLEINPSILAPRKSIESLIQGNTDTAVTQGWRGKLIGPALQSVLSGEKQLHINDGTVVIS